MIVKPRILIYFCPVIITKNLRISMAQEDVFKKLVAHCKEYGYVFPSSEIYDGLGAVYDYGQYGVELKNNIKKYWWDSMVLLNENIVGLDSAIFMHPTIWKASGHVDAFNDPLIDNRDSKKRYRADVLIEEHLEKFSEKIEKEVEKARSRFGEKFDEALYSLQIPVYLRPAKSMMPCIRDLLMPWQVRIWQSSGR